MYTDNSIPIIESNKFLQYCQQLGITSERLFGCKEISLEMGLSSPQGVRKSRIRPLESRQRLANSSVKLTSSDGEKCRESVSPLDSSAVIQQPRAQVGIKQQSKTLQPPMNTIQSNEHQEHDLEREQRRAIAAFLSTLAKQDIRLWVEEKDQEIKLRCNAPKGVLTKNYQTQIKTRKPEIIAFLQRQKGQLTQTKTLDLPSEVQLDPEISPENCKKESSNPVDIKNASKTFLLTGANGFLGSFILFELLKQTNARIYCLVRAETDSLALNRVRSSLSDYDLWGDITASEFDTRIIPLVGDLSQPKFGLSDDQFIELAQTIDVIYHNGAWVHHGSPYSLLKPTNVLGTQEILRLACTEKIKPVHFVSTISVFPLQAQNPVIYEQDSLANYALPTKGYAQTKWVSESMMAIAHERGLPINIYRLGPISGHSKTGVFNANDFLYRLMMGYIQLGSAPDGEVMLDVLPVDYASQALVYLSIHSSSASSLDQNKNSRELSQLGLSKILSNSSKQTRVLSSLTNVFHLLHASPVSSKILFKCIQQKGYEIQRIAYDQWRRKLLAIAQASPDHHLYPLVALFPTEQTDSASSSNPENESIPVTFDCQNAIEGLQASHLSCPPIDENLIDTYLSYLIKTNQIQPPDKSPCTLA